MKQKEATYFPKLQNITQAKITLKDVALHTPLQLNQGLSEEFKANILLKREDLQTVRSYKIRGTFNKIAQISKRNLIIPIYLLLSLQSAGQPFRYIRQIFDETDTLKNIEYTQTEWLNNPILFLADYNIHEGEHLTEKKPLLMDIFLPKNDTLKKRPAIIFAHGGAFILGSRQNDDMVALCDSFARRGFVTATIDYRLGMGAQVTRFWGAIIGINISGTSAERALYRAMQDGNAAIRYLKRNAEMFGIDTSKVFIAGSSAGAILALNNIYFDQWEAWASVRDNPDLGELNPDALNEPGTKANAAVAYWGAIENTQIIENETTPVFLVHGTDDDIVPFKKGTPLEGSVPPNPLITFDMPEVYGSYCIDTSLTNRDIYHETYFVEGQKHEFYSANTGMFYPEGPNAYWDTIVQKTGSFLFNLFKPEAFFEVETEGLTVRFFPVTDKENCQIHWNFGDGKTSTEWQPVHRFESPGDYKVTLTVCNDLLACDTTSVILNMRVTENKGKIRKHEIEVYPNPVSNRLNLKGISGPSNITVYDMTGRRHLMKNNFSEDFIMVNYLDRGIYVLKIEIENEIFLIKFVKNRTN